MRIPLYQFLNDFFRIHIEEIEESFSIRFCIV